EENKNLQTVGGLYEHLILHHFDRNDLLLALGGGVVGDLTGFTSATYLRGIDFIQVPTTLLSQVDSSIGGKTGVDFLQYKNMVGAFYQPKLVYMNVSVLRSLPKIQLVSGMAEIIKHGLIKDAAYYQWLKEKQEEILALSPPILEEMIEKSCHIKREVVERDPNEKGERALLNFGHTIGHAVEKLSDFRMSHGACVGIGMLAATYLSWKMGMLAKEDLAELETLLASYGFQTQISGFSPTDILLATKSDKKMDGNRIRFILLKAIGEAYICKDLTDDDLIMGIQSICAEEAERGR
ncbi:MAG: 3-dehydroquinate synthase, partial [Suilimivivens sp.]